MIVVTGANGFIGSAIVWELNQRGHKDIVGVDAVPLSERPQLLQRAHFIDFLPHDHLFNYLNSAAGPKIHYLIHMGACSDTTEMNVEFLRANNTEYTQKLFEWCALHQIPFIYASSGATYGAGDLGFDDATPPDQLHALNPYGESKAAFDRWVVQQKRSPPVWFGLKFFNVYGPQEYHKGAMASVVFKASNQIRDTGKLKLFRSHHPDYEDGKQKRDFIYVKDVTGWIWDLMQLKTGSGIYNMGFGQARTWLDLARAVFENMKMPMQIEWIDVPLNIRDQYQYFTEAKMDRLFALGLRRPEWSLESGIHDYVQNYLLQEDPFL